MVTRRRCSRRVSVQCTKTSWWPSCAQDSGSSSRHTVGKVSTVDLIDRSHYYTSIYYYTIGIGKDHTKFSPVATASYRLLPGKSTAAELLHVYCFDSMSVF